ncbi:hypothetical protein JOQ06_020272 [Pogonophryne albipinna]|uniref:Uncharacterized protein n=1 Tax=Pogonophryne albipinna TaxID=1090488 RepID=A0AAD6BSZ8_9TELE|nr:hypothetical protein JOQ06_020272 [Pogonophryne albipinna]
MFLFHSSHQQVEPWSCVTPAQLQGFTAASIHRRDPTTERHGGFDLLRVRPGPLPPSLDYLVVPGSRSTISIQNLVRTPVRHSPCSSELLSSNVPPASASR